MHTIEYYLDRVKNARPPETDGGTVTQWNSVWGETIYQKSEEFVVSYEKDFEAKVEPNGDPKTHPEISKHTSVEKKFVVFYQRENPLVRNP